MAILCTKRVSVIDQHDVVRAGVESWLASGALVTAGSFRDPADYATWVRTHGPADVVVTEIVRDGSSPDIDGLRTLCADGTPVVVYSQATADEVILASLDAGAFCYVAKTDGREHLLAALASIDTDEPHVSPHMAAALDRSRVSGRLHLSERERQVLVAWLRTGSKDDVSQQLHITPATVRTHLQRIRIKYAGVGRPASTKSALLARAVEDGIVGLSELSGSASDTSVHNVRSGG